MSVEQIAFPFLQEIDDKKQGIARIDGWPVLNIVFPAEKGSGRGSFGYCSGWIHRRWYWDLREALDDAIRASKLVNVKLYVVPVEAGFNKRMDGVWSIRIDPPFHGVAGMYYCPEVDYYVVRSGMEIFFPGESAEDVERKSRRAREKWESQYGAVAAVKNGPETRR